MMGAEMQKAVADRQRAEAAKRKSDEMLTKELVLCPAIRPHCLLPPPPVSVEVIPVCVESIYDPAVYKPSSRADAMRAPLPRP